MLIGNNNIPIKINNTTINTLPSYNVDIFMIEIQLANNKSLLNRLVSVAPNSESSSLESKEYLFTFGYYFNIEYIDKFPVNFMWQEKTDQNITNKKLINNSSKHKILINNVNSSSTFYDDCINNNFKKLYLIFI